MKVMCSNTENPKDHKEDYFEEVPATVICHLEKNELSSAEGIHDL